MEFASNVLLTGKEETVTAIVPLKLKTEPCKEYKYFLQNRGGSLL